jgi:type II secretory pathway pseudopilin PulG
MAALLVAMGIMAVMMSVALPVWRTLGQREKEEELIFRGRQYARAITLYQRKFGAAYPPSIDALVAGRFLRRKYKDPITDGEFLLLAGSLTQPPGGGLQGSLDAPAPAVRPAAPAQGPGRGGPAPVPGGQGATGVIQGLIGVVSKSTDQSIRVYNGRSHYNEWAFLAQAVTQQPAAPGGAQQPGVAPQRPGPGPATAAPPLPGQRPMFPGGTGVSDPRSR